MPGQFSDQASVGACPTNWICGLMKNASGKKQTISSVQSDQEHSTIELALNKVSETPAAIQAGD
jgi:hypothetical protein